MLILMRKEGESIHIGNEIVVKLVKIEGSRVRIGISAPDDVVILRRELIQGDGDDDQSSQSDHTVHRDAG